MASPINENYSSSICPQCNDLSEHLIKGACGHDKCQQCAVKETSGCRACMKSAVQPLCRQSEGMKIKTEWVNKLTHQKAYDELSNDSNILTIDTDHESDIDDSQTVPKNVESAVPTVAPGRETRKGGKRKSIEHIVERTENSNKTEKPKTVFHCTICDKKFTNPKLRLYHLYCNKNIVNPFKCVDCKKTFKNTFHLTWHRAKVHKGTSLTYRCEVCDKSFPTRNELKRHEKFHSRRDFQCHQCNNAFPSRADLHEHSLKHDKADYKFACTICKTKFRLKSNYMKHAKTHETSPSSRVKCESCDRVFANRANMLVHAQKHGGQSLLTCSVCDKAFSDRATLLRHKKQHQAKAGYYCTLCDMKSKRKDNIIRHCRSFHAEQVGNFVGIIEKCPQVETVTPKVPTIDNRVSVIMTIGQPGRKLEKNVEATETAVQPALPKAVETMANLDIYRKILSPFPAKSISLDASLPAVSVTPRDKMKNYDPLEIYRKILGPSKPESVEKAPVASATAAEPKISVAPSAQFNFNEVHWRKRTSHNLMFK